jgi:hypothetical protein
MLIECKLLRNAPPAFQRCPKCGAAPFTHLMRGQVHRGKRWFLIGPRRDYVTVICQNCKEIVGYESPPETPCQELSDLEFCDGPNNGRTLSSERKLLQRYTVRVFTDEGPPPKDYQVIACTGIDARVLAFTLDGGFGWARFDSLPMERGHIELALTWTEII